MLKYNMQKIGLQKEGTNMKTKYLHICIVSVLGSVQCCAGQAKVRGGLGVALLSLCVHRDRGCSGMCVVSGVGSRADNMLYQSLNIVR